MAATNWQTVAKGTSAAYKPLALALRNAWIAATGETPNATTEAQYAAALQAADALIAALGGGGSSTFRIQLSGNDQGLAQNQNAPSVTVMVQKIP